MNTPQGHLHELAEMDLYLKEGAWLIHTAEECLKQLDEAGACQGQRLRSAQILKVMRCILLLLQEQRAGLANTVAATPLTSSVPMAGRWWPLRGPRRAFQPKIL
ncbi:hypothetical protein [Methylobacterium nigriterrae]|uniref:hypothetical protein n=1 Tax=Methylobacterium nigriterrae TaxID=3127512 RepID=UPI003013A30F